MEEYYITLINGEVIKPSYDVHFLFCYSRGNYSHAPCDNLEDAIELLRGERDIISLSKKHADRSGDYIFKMIPKENVLCFSKIDRPSINLIKQLCQYTEK